MLIVIVAPGSSVVRRPGGPWRLLRTLPTTTRSPHHPLVTRASPLSERVIRLRRDEASGGDARRETPHGTEPHRQDGCGGKADTMATIHIAA